jgi:hypothetical protein
MEDAKLQALHDTLSQIRGKKGLGTNTQYSWQTGGTTTRQRHPAALHLPDNELYANFLPEGTYDPNAKHIDDGDGRVVKRDFSDAVMGDENDDKKSSRTDKLDKQRRKELRKAEKKAARKAEKLKAKKETRILEKKLQKKLEKKLLKKQSSGLLNVHESNDETNLGNEAEPNGKRETHQSLPNGQKINNNSDTILRKKQTKSKVKQHLADPSTSETVDGKAMGKITKRRS